VNLATYRDQGHRLDDLLRDLLALPGEFRLRLSSLEPTPVAWAVIDLMACQPRLCRFLHLPLQYGEDSLLRAMNRRYAVAEYEQLAQAAVARVPGLCLGSDVIVGFPGETEARFDACCEAVDRLPLAYLHVFTYSPRPGTEACGLPGRVHGTVAARRHRVLAELGRAKSDAFAATMVGQTVQVLVESEDESDSVEGCSDNYLRVRLPGARGRVSRRQLVQARITRRCDGRLVEGVLA
jgi:threonylcarbamoyladenosine tRNA methylthiotransferase MtaB